MKWQTLFKQGIGLAAGVLLTLVTLALAGSVMADVEKSARGAPRTAIVQEVTASPPVISYVWRLLDPATGLPKANGSYTIAFSLYDVANGGAPLWTEIKSVTVANGLFTTLLGDTTPLNLSQFNGQDLFLGITVGSDPEASPRSRLAHTAYAIRAEAAGVADNSNLLGGQGPGAFAAAGHTHDASQVIAGTLDNARFSAYSDLLAEGRIGATGSQLTTADHLSYLKVADWSESIVVNTTRQYFTANHLVATPQANGYILVHGRVRYNCPGNIMTQSSFGIYASTSATPPTTATAFTDSNPIGYAFPMDTSGNGGDFNPNVITSAIPVTARTTYHIWIGVDGINIGTGCNALSPQLIATFHPSGL